MASEPAFPLDSPAPPAAPLGGSRSQAMQRLQVGVFGLAAMVLLVGLANIFITNARHNEVRSGSGGGVAASSASAQANDPLADAGVVPDMADGSAPGANSTAPAPAR